MYRLQRQLLFQNSGGEQYEKNMIVETQCVVSLKFFYSKWKQSVKMFDCKDLNALV
jgi:hypothetical protein